MSVSTSYEFLEKVIQATPDGEYIRKCLQCGTCGGICPYGFAMDYTPRSLIAALRAGVKLDSTDKIETTTNQIT